MKDFGINIFIYIEVLYYRTIKNKIIIYNNIRVLIFTSLNIFIHPLKFKRKLRQKQPSMKQPKYL